MVFIAKCVLIGFLSGLVYQTSKISVTNPDIEIGCYVMSVVYTLLITVIAVFWKDKEKDS